MNFNAPFYPQDPFKFEATLTNEELSIMLKVREFAKSKLEPLVIEAFRNQNLAVTALQQFGELQLFGGDIAYKYGGPKISAVAYGLIARELERVDSGFRTIYSVMGSLVMKSIDLFGSQEHKDQYLPLLNSGKIIGCFGLTEPDHGSDPSGMETTAIKTADGYLLNGKKRWIGLAPYADIFIIWAKDEDKIIRGFIVEKAQAGLNVVNIDGKVSLRTAPQGEITLNNVIVPSSMLLPLSNGIISAFACLNHARYGIAWGALGAAEDCLHVSLAYAKSREQFGVPLAAKQLVQKKLVDMQVEIALGLNSALTVGRLIDDNKASHLMINMLKYNSAVKALAITRLARDILGGNGILDEQRVMRHLVNLETVNTYEGTADIHCLTLGRALTGHSAF